MGAVAPKTKTRRALLNTMSYKAVAPHVLNSVPETMCPSALRCRYINTNDRAVHIYCREQ